MHNIPQHLLVEVSATDVDKLLLDWRWLMGEDKCAWFLPASEDVFLNLWTD